MLNNHLRFTILYHKNAETDLSRIVGFEVEPFSVKHTYDGEWKGGKVWPKSAACHWVSSRKGGKEGLAGICSGLAASGQQD